MNDTSKALAAYKALLVQLDAYERHILKKCEGLIFCKDGCSSCCILKTVNKLEAAVVLETLKNIDAATKETLLKNKSKSRCPLLLDGSCTVYQNRPVICRTHGYPLTAQNKTVYCRKNFKTKSPDDFGPFLEIEKLDTALAAMAVQYQTELGDCADSDRVSLRRLLRRSMNG
ncbi:MAG: YkgJ family cysteine cluster protein [Fibrobacteres bacterium]|nr:YkgJ family cysteine cluster protein [Fibrobacterota bacterium]